MGDALYTCVKTDSLSSVYTVQMYSHTLTCHVTLWLHDVTLWLHDVTLWLHDGYSICGYMMATVYVVT